MKVPRIHPMCSILYLIVVVVGATRFGHVYPQSSDYIALVAAFRGLISFESVRAPFAYRFALPFLASLGIPYIHAVLIFSVVNLFAMVGISLVTFQLCREFGVSDKSALFTSILCTVSVPMILYGPVVLVDALAVFVIGLIMLLTFRGEKGRYIMVLLVLGVMIQETVLLAGIFYVLWRGAKKVWILIPAVVAHLTVRYLTHGPAGLTAGIGTLHGFNFTGNWVFTLGTVVLTMAIPVYLTYRYSMWKRHSVETDPEKRGALQLPTQWWTIGMMVFWPLVVYGLFFCWFDARFLWPLYFVFAPTMARMIEVLRR